MKVLNKYMLMPGKVGRRDAPHSDYLVNDSVFSIQVVKKPWKRKRKIRARLKTLQRRSRRKHALLILRQGRKSVDSLIKIMEE